MTIEKRITAEVGDVRSVIIVCKECGFSQGFSPKKWNGSLPYSCPNCPDSRKWPETGARQLVETLGSTLGKLADMEKGSPFKIQLQFDAE